jgi:phenylacetate-CoA ligase
VVAPWGHRALTTDIRVLSLLPATAVRLLRKFLLSYGRRMNPERMLASSRRGAMRSAAHAAQHSAAYRALLQEQGINPSSLCAQTDLADLPVLTKANTFERFPLDQLARPTPPKELADVLTSSGRSGRSFGYRITAREQHETSWFDIDLGLQDVFNVDEHATLLVNCLPMGVVFNSHAVAVANLSVPSCATSAPASNKLCCAPTLCSSGEYLTRRALRAWTGRRSIPA